MDFYRNCNCYAQNGIDGLGNRRYHFLPIHIDI